MTTKPMNLWAPIAIGVLVGVTTFILLAGGLVFWQLRSASLRASDRHQKLMKEKAQRQGD